MKSSLARLGSSMSAFCSKGSSAQVGARQLLDSVPRPGWKPSRRPLTTGETP
ncbi:hypothetical protein [Streptomyces sp. NBC_00696]|uniref:hypothetical protein n=1 Tax=Streptomyces sp. NBC_00696 TaxID=2903672 RepID=UPI002E37144A|nr:hypothetical protein [Streptomyces sp. NBC_00696]